ncbi:MAG: family 43 glycosylhydrolase [Bacteroidales bacterium]|nr:family 43 glycosylhydrolase [Bacteroidales bacterium]
MTNKNIILGAALCMLSAGSAFAQGGKPFIHDPSCIVECNGKYYTFGTGGGGLISPDGWHWESGAVRPGGGAAPDAIKIGDRYLIAYSTTGGGMGGGHASAIMTMWNKDLDPNSPDFGYTEAVEVASSLVDEDCNAIDAGLLMGPDGRLWCTYGTYFGHIRQVELDPETGFRKEGNEAIDIGRNMEASTMMYRDGWYYLLGTHGTCCDGVNSTYNIVVGRSRNPHGPFIDNVGRSMIEGGGKMVINAENRLIGPGHFGRYIEDEGIEKMSFHWEADMDQSGRSVLAIRPLLWKNGWPVAGEAFQSGTYEIQSERSGYALELATDFVRMNSGMGMFGRGNTDQPVVKVEQQKLSEVIDTWPTGNAEVRNGYYMGRPNQRWSIIPVDEAGGYVGGQYYKILIEGTNRALAATAACEVEAVAEYTGADEQLWRIEQCTDGTFRIMPKAIPGTSEKLALVSLGDCKPTLAPFDFNNDNCKWAFKCFTQIK